MTLASALAALRSSGALDADPGPVRAAKAYVANLLADDGHLGREGLTDALDEQDPLLVGALTCLLRHVTGRPHLAVLRVDHPHFGAGWAVVEFDAYWGWRFAYEPHAVHGTELDAVIAALVAEAEARIPRWAPAPEGWALQTRDHRLALVQLCGVWATARVWTTERGREELNSPPLSFEAAKAWAERTVCEVREAGALPGACAWPPR